MRGFVVRLRPSLWTKFLAAWLHVLAFLAIIVYVQGWERVWWLLLWLGCALWSGFGLRRQVIRRIDVDNQLQAKLWLEGQREAVPATLASSSMVRRGFMALSWYADDGIVRVLLLPDMMDTQSWRRLQVWVRWCQPQQAQFTLWQSIRNKIIRPQKKTDSSVK